MFAHTARSQVSRLRVALVSVALLVAALVLAGTPGRVAAAGPCAAPDANGVVVCTFGYTGQPQFWEVPAGVQSFKFDVYGAHGAGDPSFGTRGGNGAWVSGTLLSAPSDAGRVFTLIVGGHGGVGADNEVGGYGGGGNGGGTAGAGGGGGASWVYTVVPSATPGDEPVTLYAFVAGGGGGAGDLFSGSGGAGNGGDSGSAGDPGGAAGNGGGGGGGGAGSDSAGGAAGTAGAIVNSQQTCGSARGTETPSTAGAMLQGGNGGVPDSITSTRGEVTYLTNGGGGGGGGWYGGGGGGASWSCLDGTGGGGGGGGGSSFSIDENATITEGFIRRSSDGLITITYTQPVTDTTAPVVDAVVTGTQGTNGWYTSSVGIDFTVSDPESNVTTTCTDRTLSTDGAAISVTCSATSAGGTTPYSRTFKIDKTKPSLAPVVTPDPVDYGQPATASPNATDATSGVASQSCPTPSTTTVGLAFLICSATDNAGNSAIGSASYTVVDPTEPVIDYVLTGTKGSDGWYRSNVGIDFTVTDSESAVTTTCDDRTVSTEGSAIGISCSATSSGGTTLFALTLRIDKTKPVLDPTVTPDPVTAGSAAVAEPNASDALSGLASSSCETPDTAVAGPQSVPCTATDVAGNTATADATYTVTDTTAPVVDAVVTGTQGTNGWYTSNVVIDFTVSDPESNVTTTCTDRTLSTDGAAISVTCEATSAGGTTPYSRTFKIDKTKPSLSVVVTPNPVAYGQTATTTLDASDAMSGVASGSCPEVSTTTVGNQSVTCTATDFAGNTTTQSAPYTVTDPTAPVIDYDLTGTRGDNGWYRSNVAIDFTVTDPESDVTTTCTDRTVSTEGSAVAVTCAATSAGGTTPFTLTLKIDKTSPRLDPTVTPNPVILGGTAVAAPNAADATSGIASASCGALSTSTAGAKTVSCTAKDKAGNTTTASASYTVAYRLVLQKPPAGTTVKPGSTVVVMFTLADASGTRLSDAQAQALVTACLARVSWTGGALSPDCATYNAVNDVFTFELKTPKNVTGDQTVTVRVYAGSDVVNTASLGLKLKN